MSPSIGQTFELWTITGFAGKEDGHTLFDVVCRCGNTSVVRQSDLKCGRSTSCGICVLMKGYVIEYKSAHTRIYRTRGYAAEQNCIDCGEQAAQWSYNYTDPNPISSIHGPYSLNPFNYAPRCKPCHKLFDKEKTTE